MPKSGKRNYTNRINFKFINNYLKGSLKLINLILKGNSGLNISVEFGFKNKIFAI